MRNTATCKGQIH